MRLVVIDDRENADIDEVDEHIMELDAIDEGMEVREVVLFDVREQLVEVDDDELKPIIVDEGIELVDWLIYVTQQIEVGDFQMRLDEQKLWLIDIVGIDLQVMDVFVLLVSIYILIIYKDADNNINSYRDSDGNNYHSKFC